MKSIKSLDLFEKITVDNVVKPTVIGALISIFATMLILYLIAQEIIILLTPSIKKDAIIYHDNQSTNEIPVHFSIKLLNAPCPMISVDREDLIGGHDMDIKEDMIKMRLDKNNNQIQGSYIPYKLELLEQSIKNKESCYIKGFIPINKAPGDIHFSFHNFRDVWDHLRENKRAISNLLNVNHQFINMSFGDKEINQIIEDKFYREEVKELPKFPTFDQEIKYSEKHSDQFYNYDYYIKLIPHLYVDEIGGVEYLTYHHSLSYKSQITDSEEEMPIIMVNYDISPITMKITLEKKSISRFLIHICAIVGGVFVIFSILNNILLALTDEWYSSKSNSEKRR